MDRRDFLKQSGPTAFAWAAARLLILPGFDTRLLAKEESPLSGEWSGSGWGTVVLYKAGNNAYEGTYSDTYGKDVGRLSFSLVEKREGRYAGKWWEGRYRIGTLRFTVAEDGMTIQGTHSASNESLINPGNPTNAAFQWTRKTIPLPDLSGDWSGSGWGNVLLRKAGHNAYEGTYSDTYGKDVGRLSFSLVSESELRYAGRWWEGKYRIGTLTFTASQDGKTIQGTHSASTESLINPGNPTNATFQWQKK